MKSNNYELAIDSLPVNIIVYRWGENDYCIVDINTHATETEQTTKDSIIGKDLCDVFPNVKEDGLFDVLREVDKTSNTKIFNTNLFVDTSMHGWRKNEVSKLNNGNILVMYQDITKEKDLEKTLREVAQFIDNSQTILFFRKAEGGWPVEYLSDNISDLGYSKNDFLSNRLKYKDIIHKDDIDKVTRKVEQCTKERKDKFKQIYRIITADGKIRWIDDRTFIKRDKYEMATNYLGTITDITESIETQNKLKESEEQFHAIAENSLMGIFIYQSKYMYVNPAISQMTGYTAEELYKMSPTTLVDKNDVELYERIALRRLNGEKFPKSYSDVKITTKNGKVKIARMMTETISYKGSYAGLGTIIDITDMKRTSNKLKILAQAMEQTDELVMITDKDGIITYINDAYVAHTGYRRNELLNKDASISSLKNQDKELYKYLWDVIDSGETFSNIVISSKNKICHFETTITPILNTQDEIINYVSTSKDITQRRRMEEELTKRANFDNLTAVSNRYSGNEILEREIDKFKRYNSDFALIMLDIDYFKNINDTYGHDVGDNILIQLTQLISVHMRKSDHLIRWGGEEFIIISEHIDAEKAQKFAYKLNKIISSYEFEKNLNITASFGVSVMQAQDTKQLLLKRVDDALYQAKNDGRNCVKFL